MAEERKILPTIDIVQYDSCDNNHLHIVFMDKDGNELGELILHDPEEATGFVRQLLKNCRIIFVGNHGEVHDKEPRKH